MPLLTSTPGSRYARSRNRQTRTMIAVQEGAGAYGETVVTCERHGSSTNATTWNAGCETARTPQTFCEQCRTLTPTINRAQRRSAARRATSPAARTGNRLGIARRFGVEFECFGVERYTIRRFLEANSALHGWNVKGDASITGPSGNEIVSPPLSGEAGLEQVRIVLNFLNEQGAQVNRSCGTHVHLDAADVDIAGLKLFARSYAANQDLIDWLVAPSRRDNHGYCARLTDYDLRAIDNVSDRYGTYRLERYRTVNVSAFGRHGTVEVRQHQGTLSYSKIESFIRLIMGMLDTVAESGTTIPAQDGIRSLLNAAQVEEEAAAYLLGRAIQFGAPAEQVIA